MGFINFRGNGGIGIPGPPGKDGFSPEIDVSKETETTYVLRIKTATKEFYTPNLKGNCSSTPLDSDPSIKAAFIRTENGEIIEALIRTEQGDINEAFILI